MTHLIRTAQPSMSPADVYPPPEPAPDIVPLPPTPHPGPDPMIDPVPPTITDPPLPGGDIPIGDPGLA